MIIWAVFMCYQLQDTGSCALQVGIPHYASRLECEASLHQKGMPVTQHVGNRFILPPPDQNQWFECRSRHVDVWKESP
jgi:hypothetical protein